MKKPASPWRLLQVVVTALALIAMVAAGAACGGSSSDDEAAAASAVDTVVGAGASFPYPLYAKWGGEYNAIAGVKLNYQSIGSGGGISAIKADTVDFGASDAPLEEAELDEAGLAQFPMCVGGVVPVINLEGVAADEMRLDAETLARIFNGDITTWDDKAIAALNPDLSLPGDRIGVVHRSDSSGTTWIFTNYLTAAAGDVWTAGADKEVAWPTGVGGKGNEGVAASVQQLTGSIGYVEYAYAAETGMTTTQMRNKDGEYVTPSLAAFRSAAAEADWQGSLPSMHLILVDQPGAGTWPIAGASFILVQKDQADAGRAQTMLEFFDWAYANGAASAEALDYVPIPKKVYNLVKRDVWIMVTVSGTPVWQ